MSERSSRRKMEVTNTFPSGFAEKVHYDWVKSENPATIMTCTEINNVLIIPNKSLYCRSTASNLIFSWDFEIVTNGKQLRRVALTSEHSRRNFLLKFVKRNGVNIGVTNGQEWYNPEQIKLRPKENAAIKEERYHVRVSLFTNKYGTYRQNIIFYFGEYPVILRKLCMDSMPPRDFTRIHEATNYQFTQNPNSWINGPNKIYWFKSPFVSTRDPKEKQLSMMYPFPNRNNFFLTQETLTQDRLTRQNYAGRLHELITVEELAQHEQIARYNESAFMRILDHYDIVSSDGSTITKFATAGELFAQLPLSRSITDDTQSGRLFLKGCKRVFIKSVTRMSNVIYEAYIEDKCRQSVYIRLSKQCVNMLHLVADTDLHVQVQFILSRLPFCQWHRTVDSLPNLDLVFLNKSYENMTESSFLSSIGRHESSFGFSLLNIKQEKALALMTASNDISLPPILALGPFGTGKTFTIAQSIRMLLLYSSEYKILLCTESESAADIYIKEFFSLWFRCEKRPQLKPIRIYYKGRHKNTIDPAIQDYCLKNYNGTIRSPTERDLRNCSLIVTTLSTSSCLTSLNLAFTHIVIDEAAQALECDALIPLSMATSNTRIVLAGDQMQLAPEVFSVLARERGLGVSLLDRISAMYPRTHPCRIHLHQNYRAQHNIICFTSEIFYDGMVMSATSMSQLNIKGRPVLKPFVFYAVQGVEEQDIHTTGYANMSEVYELVDRVQELRNRWPTNRWGAYNNKSIGVLVYYAEQAQKIRNELKERSVTDVTVETVINVQGKQFTTVFISTVRTRQSCRYSAERNIKDYGFFTNVRLLNTAITRAKCMVAVVGDPVALLTIGSCKNLWEKYLDIAVLYGISRQTLAYHLSLVPKLPPFTPLNPLARVFVPENRFFLVEYVPVPMLYPVFHYPSHPT